MNHEQIEIRKPRRIATGEYEVRAFVNGRRHEGRTYYTDDKGDAFATFEAMVAEAAAENARNGER